MNYKIKSKEIKTFSQDKGSVHVYIYSAGSVCYYI